MRTLCQKTCDTLSHCCVEKREPNCVLPSSSFTSTSCVKGFEDYSKLAPFPPFSVKALRRLLQATRRTSRLLPRPTRGWLLVVRVALRSQSCRRVSVCMVRLGRHSLDSSSTSARCISSIPQLSKYSISRDDIVLREKIGHGAYGWVHVAELHGRKVAAKFLHVARTGEELDEKAKRKLTEEAHRLALKRHENIVAFKGISNQLGCIVTEYCPNRSLYDVMRDEEYQHLFEDFTYRVRWLEQIAAAMICLHHQRPCLMHRDVTPRNIFLDRHLDAKVGDFGLACIVDLFDDIEAFRPRSMESNLMLLYQPPEVIAGSMANPRVMNYSRKSDVYSYGVLIRDLLTMKTYFGIEGPHAEERIVFAMRAVQEGRLRPEIPEDRTELPGEFSPCLEPLVALMRDCCEEDPERRPDFKTIHERISRIREDLRREMQSRETLQRCSHASVIVTAAGCVLVLAIALLACYAIKDLIRCGGHFSPESTAACILAGIVLALLVAVLVYQAREWYKRIEREKKKTPTRQPLSNQELHKLAKQRNGNRRIRVAKTKNPPVSPFVYGAGQSLSSCSMAVYGDVERHELPVNWMVICRRLVEELPASSTCQDVQTVREFCLQHLVSGQVTQRSWQENFVKYCLTNQVVMETSAWKAYETARRIPMEATIDIPPDARMPGSPPCTPRSATSPDPFAAGPSKPLAIPNRSPSFTTRTPEREAEERSEANSSVGGGCVRNDEIQEVQSVDAGGGVESSAVSGGWSTATVHSSMFRLANRDEATGDDASRGFSFCPSNASTQTPCSEN